jgi:hypothetical protein
MQLVAVALIVGVIAYLIGVISIVGHAENRSVARSRSGASMVTAVLSGVDGRVRCQGAVDVDFSNRSARPVIVGLSVRADFFPGWPRVRHNTKVVSRPERRRYRADAQGTIGVIPANGIVRLSVPAPHDSCRRRVVAVVGEADGHLRVISVRIPPKPMMRTNQYTDVAIGDLFMWLL